jgi:hypothetical protein
VDDWERRFIGKSRRRSQAERRERRNRRIRASIAGAFIALLIIAGVAELAMRG